MPPDASTPLADLRPGDRAAVRRVACEDPDLLRQLGNLGLVPGAELHVQAHSPSDRNLTIEVSGREAAVIDPAVSSQVYVEILPGKNP
jgi:Fe2+ transport system protein FeoA